MNDWKLNKLNIFMDDDPNPGGDDPPKDPPKDSPKSKDDPPVLIAYDRFKEVYDEKAELQKQLDKILKDQKAADDKKLAEENQWKTLAEQREQEINTKNAELLRLKVAARKRLPVDLIDRLRGDTEEEIEADADKLLEFIKSDDSPGNPGKKKGGASTVLDIKTMSPEEIRKHTAELLRQGQ